MYTELFPIHSHHPHDSQQQAWPDAGMLPFVNCCSLACVCSVFLVREMQKHSFWTILRPCQSSPLTRCHVGAPRLPRNRMRSPPRSPTPRAHRRSPRLQIANLWHLLRCIRRLRSIPRLFNGTCSVMARGDAFNFAAATGVQYAAVRPLTLCMKGLAMLVVMCCLRRLARSCWLVMLAGKCITATDHARSKDGRSTGMCAMTL